MYAHDLASRRATTRALLNSSVTKYSLEHATEIKERDKAIQSGDKRKAKIVPPMAIEVTVGAGKSRAVSDTIVPLIHGADMPILILAPTRALCHEYAKSIKESGIDDFAVYRPREEVKPGEPSTPFSCYQIKQINAAGAKHQRPAHSICRQCPHGHKAAMMQSEAGKERAIKFFNRNNFSSEKISKIEPCRYLYEGLPDQLKKEILIAPAAAFSDALATVSRFYVDDKGRDIEKKMQRLIIIDERHDLTETIHLSNSSVSGWLNTIDRTIESLSDSFDDETEIKNSLIKVQDVLEELSARLSKKLSIDDDLKAKIQDAHRAIKNTGLIDGGTTSFEKVSFLPDDADFLIPLRAFNATAHAIKNKTDEIEARTIRLAVPKPITEWMLKHGSTIVLDATLDPTLRELIKEKNGKVINAQTPQNIKVTRVVGKMFARGAVRSDDYAKRAMNQIRCLEKIASRMQKPAAIITHKAFLDRADPEMNAEELASAFEHLTGVKLGWFGKHDRGHNEWARRHISIVGMPIFSKSVIESLWQERRVLMQMIGREIEPLHDSESDGAFIPADTEAQTWLFDLYAATLVQSIGRARGINHEGDEPLQIHLYGGLVNRGMDAALARYLVTISDTEAFKEVIEVQRENDPRWRIRAAIEEIARGRKGAAGVSQRSVETWLIRSGYGPGKTQIILDELKKWKSLNNQ